MSVTQLKDGRWIVQYPNPDKGEKPRLIREYFGRGPSARLKAEQRDSDLSLKQTRPKAVDDSEPRFYELAAEYLKYKNFSANSSKHAGIRQKANILPLLGPTPAIKLTYTDMDRYVIERRQQGLKNPKMKHETKNSTIRREITDIKAILNWAVKRRPPLIPYNPIRDYKSPEADDAVIMPPTPEEAAAILSVANERLRRAIALSWYTGLRPGAVELLSLTWSNVLWDRNVIRIQSAHKGGPELRDVPIHPDFLLELRKWWETDGKGFGPIIHYRGKPILKLQMPWERALKKAGIKRRIRPYDLRHYFVTRAIEEGTDYKTLSEIVGSSPETLRRHYQHVSNESR
ncbi:MAG: site-specific integrase, partial [Desulfatirhabdiaceae bacterium]